MPTILPNTFTTIQWNEGEEEAARTFSDLNKLYLISLRGDLAQKKLLLTFLPESNQAAVLQFVQAQAFLDGQLQVYNLLIDGV